MRLLARRPPSALVIRRRLIGRGVEKSLHAHVVDCLSELLFLGVAAPAELVRMSAPAAQSSSAQGTATESTGKAPLRPALAWRMRSPSVRARAKARPSDTQQLQ